MKTQLQVHVSWAPTQEEAEQNALTEWPNGGMPFPKQDIRNPEDFESMAKLVRIEDFANRMLISADLDEHTAQIQHFVDMGFDEIYLHNVGRDQAALHRRLRQEGPSEAEALVTSDRRSRDDDAPRSSHLRATLLSRISG